MGDNGFRSALDARQERRAVEGGMHLVTAVAHSARIDDAALAFQLPARALDVESKWDQPRW